MPLGCSTAVLLSPHLLLFISMFCFICLSSLFKVGYKPWVPFCVTFPGKGLCGFVQHHTKSPNQKAARLSFLHPVHCCKLQKRVGWWESRLVQVTVLSMCLRFSNLKKPHLIPSINSYNQFSFLISLPAPPLLHTPLLQVHFKALREGEKDIFSQVFLALWMEEGILFMNKACALIMQVSQIKQY